jgi:calcium-translocating P-type ATPase
VSATETSVPVDPEGRPELVLDRLHSARRGLTSREAARRLAQYGNNEIRREEGRSRVREFARQLIDPLALLLWAASGFALAEGAVAVAVTIVAVILLNALFAFAQELQAEKATEALKRYLPAHARVRRDGAVVEIEATDLVPGDILLLTEGDRLSADARLLDGSVEVDMAALTGESQTVARGAIVSAMPTSGSLLEAEDLVFAGTSCTGGDAEAVVYATGMATQLGRIAALTQRVRVEASPLQQQVNHAAKLIAIIAVSAGIVFFAVGVALAGLSLQDSLSFAIGLLVANVPEGLLPTITLALAVGVRRMARRRALVKRLAAVETLGSTDVICTDKTGTLTEGRMTVRRWWDIAGGVPSGALLRCAVRCNNASATAREGGWDQEGDPSESALLIGAAEAGLALPVALAERDRRRCRLLHFDARRKRMTTLDAEDDGHVWLHAKGAPLELLERCTAVRHGDAVRELSGADRDAIASAFEGFAADGLRVLGFAERIDPDVDEADRDHVEAGLTFLGLAAMEDPPRAGVAEAVARCRHAGLRIIVITGDHGATAAAIARQVGIVAGTPTIVEGPDIDRMPQADLDDLLRGAPELIVARSNPETKLHVVEALKSLGHTVAMTGDGVNDAPALRRADIGVAMGASGTDVAREAATMVLTDDSFASIAAAVEEGRVVYDNLRKFITYVFAHATPEVIPFLIFALAGGNVPLPITALQILAIDLGTETLPALALGREPAEPDVMDRPPRPIVERLIDRPILVRAWLVLGLVEAVLVTGGFFYALIDGGWGWGDPTGVGTPLNHTYVLATTMTFAGIVACQIGAGFATRTARASLRQIGPFTNHLLLWGMVFELAFAAALIWLPPLQDVFHTTALPWHYVLVLTAMAPLVWVVDEARRWWLRRAPRRAAGA